MAGPIETFFRGANAGDSSNGTDGGEPASVPMVFTSEYRRRLSGQVSKTSDELKKAKQEVERVSISVLGQKSAERAGLSPASANLVPKEQASYTDAIKKEYQIGTSVTLALNPRSISFDQPKRFSRQDTLRGSVFHHFTNSAGENNDILKLSFQGSTGSILIVPGMTNQEFNDAEMRLTTWHSLYQLTREQMYFEWEGQLVRNKFYIIYASPLIPVPITFTGFFESVLKFSETADKPRSRNYDMSFIVEEVNPPMNQLLQNQSLYRGSDSLGTPIGLDNRAVADLGGR